MGVAALAEPQAIKISSKRQITIPAQWYKEMEFGDYALCTWTEQGLLLQPLEVEDEDVTVDILRYLIEQGCEGEDLIERYQDMKRKIVPLQKRVTKAELDIAEGRVAPARDMLDRMRNKYGLRHQ